MVKQREVLTKNQIRKLLNNAKSFKVQLIIKTMVQTGMRVSELVNFKIEWINFDDKIIHIQENNEPIDWHPKRDSIRQIPVKEDLLKDLKRFIKNRRTGYVFQSQKRTTNGSRTHGRYSYRSIIRKVNRLSQTLFNKKIGTHIFRATYTTYQRKNGADIMELKKLLGHSSIKTTERYIGELPDYHSFDKVRNAEIMDLKL
jgi:integrase/recombinase XerD